MKINKEKYDFACARACMKQKDLVNAGIPKSTLSGIFKENRNVRPETVGRISKVLGCDITEIIETK